MTYPEGDRYIDSENPNNLATTLRTEGITNADPLPAWAVRELEDNLYSDLPIMSPGDTLAKRNPVAHTVFRAAWTEARTMKRAALDTRPRGDDLKARCDRAASDAVYDLCTDAMDEAVKTYVEAVSKGATP